MELVRIRAFPGPSLVAPEACLCAHLKLESSDIDMLKAHEGALMSGNEFLSETELSSLAGNLESGAGFFVGAVAGLAHHFLKEADAATSGFWTYRLDNGREYLAAVGHDNKVLAESALRHAFAATAGLYPTPVQGIFPPDFQHVDPAEARKSFLSSAPGLRKSLQVKLFTTACQQRGIPWLPLDRYPKSRNLIQIGYGRFQRLFRTTLTDHQSHLGVQVAGSKYHTALFLRDFGFPVPTQRLVTTGHAAREAAMAIGFPVVVKPERGAKGIGVHVHLTDTTRVHHAVKAIGRLDQQRGSQVVVEEWVPGNDYRLTVAAGHFLSAGHRKPAQIRGDGQHSITDLIRIANEDPKRGDGVTTHLVKLQLGDAELALLREQSFDADTVLAQDQVALLRRTGNVATGGTPEVVTDQVHPDNRALAVRVADALNMEILALDVISPDIGVSFLEGGFKIIEVNSGPGVQTAPAADGSGLEARAGEILDLLFPAQQRCLVPIVTVTGGAAAARVAGAVSDGLNDAGHAVGLASHVGLTIKGVPWARSPDVDARDPAFHLLRNREVDAVVVERGYNALQISGVGSGGCDVAIVLDLPDAIPDGPNSFERGSADRVVAMLCEAARIATVMSVDDPACARLAATTPADRLCVVSLHGWSKTIQERVADGAKAVVLETVSERGLRLITVAGGRRHEIFLDLSGEYFRHEKLADLLPACAASFCLGYSSEVFFSRYSHST